MPKKIISATIEEFLLRWLDQELKSSREFRNKSHLIEEALQQFKESRSQNSKKGVNHGGKGKR